VAFWNLLDKKGQGYFMGMWFLALVNADIRTIEGLSGESSFLTNALAPIIENLRVNLGDFLESPSPGGITYIDAHHARIPFRSAGGPDGEEYVPLVLELAPAGSGNAALTCWKVDTFKCIQFAKEN
jgi:hypothetical protein